MAADQLSGASVRTNHPTSIPAVAPGHHLAPVALGAPGPDQKIVFVSEPDWCRTNHISEWVHFLEDLNHTGDAFAVEVGSFFNGDKPVYTLSATVGSDPMSSDPQMRAAHVVVGDAGSVDAYLTPDMAEAAAADLRRLADALDENARTARLHNEAAEAKAVVA
ncbi:DUF6907 domain-containing protein [Streptomyces echinatus]|uniref:Uncharacterized protein n=1 Tax=Streptomyces echinatus TaxID=67293 RepID=A0A7W9UV32_9ACTN|nr:hypothetical protein [Streptomyces echinatus]MBB5932340.1 hypothetical protein [Streptomyces echinatus]